MFAERTPREAICYFRQSGLLALAALQQREGDAALPVAVAEGKLVRDASPSALSAGVRPGESVTRARRLCPLLLVVPLEAIDARPLSRMLWNALAQLSPTVEPDGPDAAYLTLLPGEENLLRGRSFPASPPPFLPLPRRNSPPAPSPSREPRWDFARYPRFSGPPTPN
jgi:nucleotidyltransferase/DNA polymerase involved in DNA repair